MLQFARQRNDGDSAEYGALVAFAIEHAVYRILPVWAMHEGNSAESVEAAAVWINEYRQDLPAWSEVLRGGYRMTAAT